VTVEDGVYVGSTPGAQSLIEGMKIFWYKPGSDEPYVIGPDAGEEYLWNIQWQLRNVAYRSAYVNLAGSNFRFITVATKPTFSGGAFDWLGTVWACLGIA